MHLRDEPPGACCGIPGKSSCALVSIITPRNISSFFSYSAISNYPEFEVEEKRRELQLDEICLLVHFFFEPNYIFYKINHFTFGNLAGRPPKTEEAANTTH